MLLSSFISVQPELLNRSEGFLADVGRSLEEYIGANASEAIDCLNNQQSAVGTMFHYLTGNSMQMLYGLLQNSELGTGHNNVET